MQCAKMEREDPTTSDKDKYGSRKVIPKPYPVGTATPTIREEFSVKKSKVEMQAKCIHICPMTTMTDIMGDWPMLVLANITLAKEMAKPLARANGRANKDFVGFGLNMVDVLGTTSTTAATTILLT